MYQALESRILFKLEDCRLRLHFKRVENILQNRDVSHLAPQLQAHREHYLKLLHAYAERGIFPRNYEKPNYSPCFIDPDGRECAVAHLVMSDGHSELVNNIVEVANYAYVPEMNFPELQDWAAQAGLSQEELALIQPGYWFTLADILPIVLATWVTGIVAFVLNAMQYKRKQQGFILPTLALVVTVFLLLVTAYLLLGTFLATSLIHDPEVPKLFREQAAQDTPPLLIATIISLGMTMFTGGIGFYRLREFLRTRPKRRRKKRR